MEWVSGPILAVFLLEKPSHRLRAHHRARPGLRWGEYSRDQAAHCADRTREEETCPTMRHGASRGHHVFSPVDTCKNVGEMRHQRAMQTMRRLANRGARSAATVRAASPISPFHILTVAHTAVVRSTSGAARPSWGVRDSWPQAERAPSRGRDLRWRSRLTGARAAAVGVLAFLRGLGNEG